MLKYLKKSWLTQLNWSWATLSLQIKIIICFKCHPAYHLFHERGQSSNYVFLSQFADVPVGRQQSRWAAQWAGFPPEAELRGPFVQPVWPRAPGSGAVGLHGEAVHGRKQPGNPHPAELQTAPCQTHRSEVRQCPPLSPNQCTQWHMISH